MRAAERVTRPAPARKKFFITRPHPPVQKIVSPARPRLRKSFLYVKDIHVDREVSNKHLWKIQDM